MFLGACSQLTLSPQEKPVDPPMTVSNLRSSIHEKAWAIQKWEEVSHIELSQYDISSLANEVNPDFETQKKFFNKLIQLSSDLKAFDSFLINLWYVLDKSYNDNKTYKGKNNEIIKIDSFFGELIVTFIQITNTGAVEHKAVFANDEVLSENIERMKDRMSMKDIVKKLTTKLRLKINWICKHEISLNNESRDTFLLDQENCKWPYNWFGFSEDEWAHWYYYWSRLQKNPVITYQDWHHWGNAWYRFESQNDKWIRSD